MAQVQDSQEEWAAIGRRHDVPRRSAFETRMDILKALAEGSAKPTHIMYRSNTSWNVLQMNIQALKGACLVREKECGASRTEYEITERGHAVLREYTGLLGATMSPSSREDVWT